MAERGGRLIILTGPMGAGKTTVAAELIRDPERPTAYVEGDRFWKFIVKAQPGPRHQAFRTIARGMGATATAFARDGYDAVLDFTIPPEFLARASHLFREVATHLVVLRPPIEVCIARDAARKEGTVGPAVIREFYPVYDCVPARYAVADPDLDAVATAARIRAGLDRGDYVYTAGA